MRGHPSRRAQKRAPQDEVRVFVAQVVGWVSPTGPREARPDDRLRRNPPPLWRRKLADCATLIRPTGYRRRRRSWHGNAKGGSHMKANLISIAVGIFIAVASWVPLWIVEAYDRYAMPVGLGLFALAASFVGGVIALVGLIRLVIHASRTSN